MDETPFIKGSVVYNDSAPSSSSEGSIWGTVGNALGSALNIAATVAKGYAATNAKNSGNTIGMPTTPDLTYQPANVHLESGPKAISYQEIHVNSSQHLGQQAANRIALLQAQADRLAIQQAHQRVTHLLNQLSRAQGMPTYQEFHAQHGITYPDPPDPGTLGIAQAKPQSASRSWTPEDQRQIQANLQTIQKRLSWKARQIIPQLLNPFNGKSVPLNKQ